MEAVELPGEFHEGVESVVSPVGDEALEAAAANADEADGGFAVCTLKDAVKLVGRWPGRSRLWYVSQRLVVEQGADKIESLLTRVLSLRATHRTTAG